MKVGVRGCEKRDFAQYTVSCHVTFVVKPLLLNGNDYNALISIAFIFVHDRGQAELRSIHITNLQYLYLNRQFTSLVAALVEQPGPLRLLEGLVGS